MTAKTMSTEIVEAARELRPLITKLSDRIEEERRLPEELLEPMHEAGMFRMFLPQDVGGLELDPWTGFEVVEQLSMEDASVGWCAMILSLGAWFAAYLPRGFAQEVFASKQDVLNGSFLGESKARAVEGGVVVSGRFHYASGCLHVTWLAGAIEDPRHEGDGPNPRIAAVIPISQCTIIDVWQTTGLRGTSSNDWTVEEVFVPWERTFPLAPEARTSFAPGPLYRLGKLNLPGVAHVAVHLGTARGAIDGYLARVEQRVRRGVPLKLDPAIQAAVGRADALVSAGRAYLQEATVEIWRTLSEGDEPGLDLQARLRSAKTIAMWNAMEAVDLVYEAMGAQAIMGGNPVERRFRDIHAAAAHMASSRQGFTVAGAVLMGIDPRPTPLL